MPKVKIVKPPAENHVSLRIDLASGQRIGPGKIAVLEAIDSTGSISAAGRALGMSYRRTWALVEALNQCAAKPAVQTAAGGAGGGGASLTETGHAIIRCYRAVEAEAMQAARRYLDAEALLFPPPAPPP